MPAVCNIVSDRVYNPRKYDADYIVQIPFVLCYLCRGYIGTMINTG